MTKTTIGVNFVVLLNSNTLQLLAMDQFMAS